MATTVNLSKFKQDKNIDQKLEKMRREVDTLSKKLTNRLLLYMDAKDEYNASIDRYHRYLIKQRKYQPVSKLREHLLRESEVGPQLVHFMCIHKIEGETIVSPIDVHTWAVEELENGTFALCCTTKPLVIDEPDIVGYFEPQFYDYFAEDGE